jgi:NCAIR mutase (PurE)-related protein
MDSERVVELLEKVRERRITVASAAAKLRHMPFEDLGFAKVDHHRALRQGFPEVIMGLGKEPEDIAAIVRAMRRRKSNILVTRVEPEKMAELKRLRTGLKFHPAARAATWTGKPIRIKGTGPYCGLCRDLRYSGSRRSGGYSGDDGQSGGKTLRRGRRRHSPLA